MAKTTKLSTGKTQLDDELDIPNFEFGSDMPKDDRNPVTKFSSGALAGAKSSLKDSEFIRRVFKISMPEGYGEALDFTDEVGKNAKQLYNTSAKEIKTSLGEMARAAEKLAPSSAPRLKSRLGNISKWFDKEGSASFSENNKGDAREKGLAATMAETFKFQMEEMAKRENRDENSSRIQEGLEIARHKDVFGQLAAIRTGVDRSNQYNEKVTAVYQKKSLELQYRHYFVGMDMLEETKKANAAMVSSMALLVKNTGLPDYVKITEIERIHEGLTNKVGSWATKSLFGNRQKVADKFVSNIGDKMRDSLATAVESFSTAAMMMEQAASMKEMADQTGMSGTELGGSIAGGAAASKAGEWLGGKVNKHITSKHKGIAKLGQQLQKGVNNAPQLMTEFGKSGKYQNMEGIKGMIMRAAQSLMPDFSVDKGVTKTSDSDLTKPYYFTKQTHKTVNEVIPGYLARIFRELQVMRTGDTKLGLTTYDTEKGTFVDRNVAIKKALNKIVGSGDKDGIKYQTDELMRTVDKDGKLSEEQRSALLDMMFKDNQKTRFGGASRMGDSYTYKANKKTAPHADALAAHMKGFFGKPDSEGFQTKENDMTSKYNRLGAYMSGTREAVQSLIDLGQTDMLAELGLLADDGNSVDYDKVAEYALGAEASVGVNKMTPNASKKMSFSKTMGATSSPTTQKKKTGSFGTTKGGQMGLSASALKKISSKEEVKESNTILARIEAMMGSGFAAMIDAISASGGGNAGAPGTPGAPAAKSGSIFSGASVNFANLLKKSLGAAGSVMKLGKRIGMSGLRTTGSLLSGAMSAPGMIMRGISSVSDKFSNLKDKLNRVRDLYLPNEELPRISAIKMKAGHYKNKLGKLIKTMNDIVGEVFDSNDNNSLVLETKDIKNLFSKSGKGIIGVGASLIGGAFKLGNKIGLSGISGAGSILSAGWNVSKLLMRTTAGLLDRPIDIYIPGRELPVLLARGFRSGEYFSRNGKAITRPGQITGTVVDAKGEVVLSLEDMQKGLFDINGKSVKSIMAKLFGIGGSILGAGFRMIRGAGRLVTGAAKGALNMVTGAAGGFLGGFTGSGGDDSEKGWLRKIHDLLDSRLPGGGPLGGLGLDDIPDRNGKGRGKAGRVTKGGRMARFGSAAGKLAKGGVSMAGRGLGAVARFLPLLLGGGGLATGAAAATAGAAGTTAAAGTLAAGTATAAGGVGILGTIGAGLATAASAALALLTSPVVLGALAIAAVGTAGYFAYKYFNSKTSALVKYRAAQYGFSAEDKDNAEKAMKLEELMIKNTIYKAGVASLTTKDFDMKKAVSIFGVDMENEHDFNTWAGWFEGRFKPVYLTHKTAMQAVNKSVALEDVDKLNIKEKVKYLEAIQFTEGPYDITYSPIPDMKQGLLGRNEVEAAYKAAKKEVDEEAKTSKNGKVTAAKEENTYDAMGNVIGSVSSSASSQLTNKKGIELPSDSRGTLTNSVATVSVTGAMSVYRDPGSIGGVEAVRLRAYGLKTMESDKVAAIRRLEDMLIPSIVYDGTGAAFYQDTVEAVLSKAGTFFGVSYDSTYAPKWMAWFKNRFLPVFLNYLGLVKQISGSPVKPGMISTLSASHTLTVATQIAGTSKIWSVTDSPYEGYEVGTDDSSCKPILSNLRDVLKQQTVSEDVLTTDKAGNKVWKSLTSVSEKDKAMGAVLAKDNKNPGTPMDGEDKVSATGGGGKPMNSTSGGDAPALAGGELYDGRNASQYIMKNAGVTFDYMNPVFMKNFNGMVDEYGKVTGKSVLVTSGFRSFAKQKELFEKAGGAGNGRVAAPGTSLHEVGLAMDIAPSTLDEMDKLGLMRKYGFTRPVGGEPWHMEAAGIQGDISGFRNNPQAATQAIENSIGKGGGGYGTISDAKKYSRDPALAQRIASASVSAKDIPASLNPVMPAVAKLDPNKKAPTMAGSAPVVMDPMGSMTGAASPDAEVPTGGYAKKVGDMGKTALNPGAIGNLSVGTGGGGKYSELPNGTGSGWNGNKDLILAASKMAGTDPSLVASTVSIESGFNSMAKASGGSASGYGQFTTGTWKEVISKYGGKYGIAPGTSPFDGKANAVMTAEYIKENHRSLKNVKPDVTGTDLYMAHFLGASGARKMLAADPSAIAAQILPTAAATNPNIFYSGGRALTVSELYSKLNEKVQTSLKQNGVPSNFATPITALAAGKPQAAQADSGMQFDAMGNSTGYMPPTAAPSPTIAQTTTVRSQNLTNAVAAPSAQQAVSVNQPMSDPRSDMNQAMGKTVPILTESLEVQKSILNAVQGILQIAIAKVGAETKPASIGEQSQAGSGWQRNPDAKVPVPMKRT